MANQATQTWERISGTGPQAAKYRVDIGLVEHRLGRLKDAEKIKERERRNRKMRQLAQKGWTNREIGQVYKLHPVTVSRIVNRARY